MIVVQEEESAAPVTEELACEAARLALLAAVAEGTDSFAPVIGHGSSPDDRFTVKSATTADTAGVKIGTYWPGNSDLPRHSSLILLFDQAIGRVGAVIGAGGASRSCHRTCWRPRARSATCPQTRPVRRGHGSRTAARPGSSTRSRRTGRTRWRVPVACHTALAIAAAVPAVPISPSPLNPDGSWGS